MKVADELNLHLPAITYMLHNGITYVGDVLRNNRIFFCGNIIHFGDAFCKNRINDLPQNLINIERKSFSGIDIISFSKMPEGLENIGNAAFSGSYFYNNGDEVDVVELPSSLKRIGAYAFNKSSIKTIIINSDIVFESGSLSGVDNLIFNIEIKECKNFEFDGRYLYSLTGKNKLLIWYKGVPEEDTFYLNDVNDVIDYDPEIDSKYIKYLVIEKSENEEVQYGDILGDFKNLIAVYIKNNVILYSDDDYDIPEYDEDYYDSIDEWKEDVEYNKERRNPTLYLIEKMNIRLFYEKDISIEEIKKICEKDIQLENIICKEYTDKESIEKKINDTKKEIVEIDDLLYKYQSELKKNEDEMNTFNTKLMQLQKEIQRLYDEKAYNNNYINLFNKSKVERKNSIIDEQIVANNQEISFVRSELEKKNSIIMEMRNRFNVEIENLKYNKKDKEFELQVLNRVWYRLYDK